MNHQTFGIRSEFSVGKPSGRASVFPGTCTTGLFDFSSFAPPPLSDPIVSISTPFTLLYSSPFPISKLSLYTSPLARRALLTVSAWVDLDARLLIDHLRHTYGIGFATQALGESGCHSGWKRIISITYWRLSRLFCDDCHSRGTSRDHIYNRLNNICRPRPSLSS